MGGTQSHSINTEPLIKQSHSLHRVYQCTESPLVQGRLVSQVYTELLRQYSGTHLGLSENCIDGIHNT